jgi:hypothetical protein
MTRRNETPPAHKARSALRTALAAVAPDNAEPDWARAAAALDRADTTVARGLADLPQWRELLTYTGLACKAAQHQHLDGVRRNAAAAIAILNEAVNTAKQEQTGAEPCSRCRAPGGGQRGPLRLPGSRGAAVSPSWGNAPCKGCGAPTVRCKGVLPLSSPCFTTAVFTVATTPVIASTAERSGYRLLFAGMAAATGMGLIWAAVTIPSTALFCALAFPGLAVHIALARQALSIPAPPKT